MRWLDGIINSVDMSEQTLGDGEGQGGLACCSPWGHTELDMTEQLKNNTDEKDIFFGVSSRGLHRTIQFLRR